MTDPNGRETDLVRLVFDLSPAGMLAIGPEGHILLANREVERMFGFGPGELRGMPVDHLVPRASRASHARVRSEYFASPEPRSMGGGRELSGRRRDGSEFPVEVGLQPVTLDVGTFVVATVLDITERRRVERAQRERDERARQAQKLESLGTLAGGIAHDFNNVLLGIVGYTELAQRAAEKLPGVRSDLEQVLRAAERGRDLVRRILLFTRPGEVEQTPIALDRVVREAAELLRASLPTTIAMQTAIEPDLPRVLAEETLVHQILLNLGTNAAHAMPQGGTLRIALSTVDLDARAADARTGLAPGRHVRLVVADNGTGMMPEVRARIFEPFYTTKAPGKGSGLGLSVILGIVRSLGGAIEVDTEPGVGTRMLVWFPALPADSSADAVTSEASAAPGTAPHVLCVEDEPALASMERRQLEALGFRVTVHTSSEEALAVFRAAPLAFDALMTDNTMPGITGLELAREVTTLRPNLPVLMVSGYADHADADVLAAHGVTAVLRKPHTSSELGEMLRRLIAGA